MKKVLKNFLGVLLGIVIFLITLFPALYLNDIYGYFPAVFLFILLLFSFSSLFLLRRKIEIEANFENAQCERGRSVDAGLIIANNSFLVCPKAVANLYISDLFGNPDSLMKTYFILAPKEKNKISFGLDMPHIGIYHVGIKEMEIYDFFGFLKKKVPIKGEFDICVKPKRRSLEEIYLTEQAFLETDQETRVTLSSGSDYVGVREYTQGDSMKQIHWKLSAHSRGYMTKLHESNLQMDFSVILDFAVEKNTDLEELMNINDCLIETALSIIEDISHQHTSYSLLYCNKEKQVCRTHPRGTQDDELLIKDFSGVAAEPEADYPDGARILQEESHVLNRSTNIIVCTSRVTQELIGELLTIKRQKRNPRLYYIISAQLTDREKENLSASLSQLEEASISYGFVPLTENLKAKSVENEVDKDE